MGGTSTDVALCQNGEPTIGRETSISHFRIKVSVNVHTVGAGGGSIARARADEGAARRPQSAGADPGPASYGRGGQEPTVTDANVVLGHLPPRLLGGEMELDADARASVQTIADAMGLGSAEEAAEGSSRSSTRTWPGRCASCRCSAATTRASSRSSRTAAPGRSTRTPSPRSWARSRCSSRRPGPPVRDRRPRGGLPRRVRADVHPGARGGRPGEVGTILDALGERAAEWLDNEGIPPTRARSRTRPTCATTARATRSRWRSTPTR